MTPAQHAANSRAAYDDPAVRHYQRQGCLRAWERRWRCPPSKLAFYRKLLRCGVDRAVARREVGSR
jgi:hypothetical protein